MPENPEDDWAHDALSIAKVVFYSADVSTSQTVRSENCAAVLGIAASAPSADWLRLIVAEDRSEYTLALAAVTPGQPGYEIEYRIRHPSSGRQVWVLDRGRGKFDASGTLTGWRGAIIEISARVGIEGESLRAARLRTAVLESGGMAAWQFDTASGQFTCTDELLALLDIDRGQFDGSLGMVAQSLHPDDREAWREAHEVQRTPGGRLEVEFRVLLRVGGLRWLLSRGELVRRSDGRPAEAFGVMIDVTERKASEEAAARLAAIVESSEDAIISKSLRGTITSWNRAAERLFGYSADEMIGESVWRLIPDQNDGEVTRILDTISRGETIPPFDSVRLHKSGMPIHVSISVSPILSAQGKVVGASTIARNVTERKIWETRQAMLLRELSHRVKNTLAVIQSIARQTLRSSPTQKAFVESFEGRICSLAASHSLLTETDWCGARLDVVIVNQLSVTTCGLDRVRLRGREVLLTAEMATQLGLVIHELTTNAVRHGALSTPGGRVDIGWWAARNRLRLVWRETGGPAITRLPEHAGFGTALITTSALKATRRFTRAGLVCRLEIAL